MKIKWKKKNLPNNDTITTINLINITNDYININFI